jgi:LAS superfamily LD-carboxypeptidase LdcB
MAIHHPYACAEEKDLIQIPLAHCRNERPFYCHRDTLPAFISLCDDAKIVDIHLVVISGFRDLAFQTELYEDAQRRHGVENASLWVAPSGHSEHHTGYALDLADKNHPETDDEPGFESTPAAAWLLSNAPSHGFELSFPKDNPQGVGYEPWHWRFCGTPTARKRFHN